ncbi:MAG TPA: TlpA disulfide reductase family protein [Ramlibacter sp.]|jgi:thiol-disulfide isomerase/thioredoxin|uniref:TlpA family protein disulfide reductase n=1 Tax=Ramlibacter sp. TaxID=1917967 RepID=UPI002D234080|nr:TlpA disulfide reductase family protein [Ramlibacter sp.]HZY18585.1 TlpA disulfide reductase family protein [Ramlibacter sp.]
MDKLPAMSNDRRRLMLAAAAATLPGWAAAQATATHSTANLRNAKARAARPMTAAEEASAARAVAESIADQTGEPVHPAVGTMPRLKHALRTFDGQEWSARKAAGKLLMVYFWASWCPICKVVSPRLHEFWLRHRTKGLELLALSTEAEVSKALASYQLSGFQWPAGMAASAGLGPTMVARSLPTLMVRSRRGVIVSVDEGDIEVDEFDAYLAHL